MPLRDVDRPIRGTTAFGLERRREPDDAAEREARLAAHADRIEREMKALGVRVRSGAPTQGE